MDNPILLVLLVLVAGQGATAWVVWRLGVSLGRRAVHAADTQQALRAALLAQAEAAEQRAVRLAAQLRPMQDLLHQVSEAVEALRTEPPVAGPAAHEEARVEALRVPAPAPAAAPALSTVGAGRAAMRDRIQRHQNNGDRHSRKA